MTSSDLRNLAKACSILDKLQVELCDETPYEIPPTDVIRDRILCAMDYLYKLVPDLELVTDEQRLKDIMDPDPLK